MRELDDNELLREYANNNSEPAFAELVARHINQVYSVALRHGGNPNQAEEITQAVFVILARKADRLRPDTILSAWLHQTARLTAVTLMRGEIRRARREHEAHMQTLSNQPETDEAWKHISPSLDSALAELSAKDRAAIVLRFFDGKSMKEVGAALSASEDAAKKRVDRAVEKLRRCLTKRGLVLPAAVLVTALATHSIQAAPSALTISVSAVAVAKGATVSTSTLTLIKGALKIMAWTKVKIAAAVAVAAVAGISVTTVAVKHLAQPKVVATTENPGDWIWEPNTQTLEQVPPLLLLQPTKMAAAAVPFDLFVKNRFLARGKTVKELLAAVYSQKDSRAKLTFLATLPDDKLDCLVTLPGKWPEALEAEINKRYNLVITYQMTGTAGEYVIRNAQ